ncbi:hypothetical protein BaRGS_00001858 [Batillaria attramentaria]|uniref:Uncharacterized protein n=1 Tax=Batillaria attramentaria TaxID=370345 RepID=A0ABD0M678_9CAEN
MESLEERSVLDASGIDRAQPDRGDEPEHVRPVDADGQETSDSGEKGRGNGEVGMSLLQKLLLNAQLMGNEANTNFAQIYTVPNLQLLGMPLQLVSLTAVVAGPAGTLLTPLLGWISDRGSNPNRRKMLNVMFCSVLLLSGVVCVVSANVLHLQSLSETINNTKVDPDTIRDTDNIIWLTLTNESEKRIGMYKTVSQTNETGTPVKAWIGLLGNLILDISFEVHGAFVKSWVLTCSPQPEHTSVLELGTVVSSAGGLLISGIATIDLEGACLWCSAEG